MPAISRREHRRWFWSGDARGNRVTQGIAGQDLVVCLAYESKMVDPRLHLAIGFYDQSGYMLCYSSTRHVPISGATRPARGIATCTCKRLPLLPGKYRLNLSLWGDHGRLDHVAGAATLEVEAGDFYGTGRIPIGAGARMLLDHRWTLRA